MFNEFKDFIEEVERRTKDPSSKSPLDESIRTDVCPDYYCQQANLHEKKCRFRSAYFEFEKASRLAKLQNIPFESYKKEGERCMKYFTKLKPYLEKIEMNIGVGVNFGSKYRVHKFYEGLLAIDGFLAAKSNLPNDFEYDVIEYDKKSNIFSFLKADNFVCEVQPQIVIRVDILPNGKVKIKNSFSGNDVIKHKWLLVNEQFELFDFYSYVKIFCEYNEKLAATDINKTYIYGIYDPRSPNQIKYVGKSDNVDIRFSQHISEAKTAKNQYAKTKWIKSLLDEGVTPEVRVLQQVDWIYDIEWGDAEIATIASLRESGHDLTNEALGGPDEWNEDDYIKVRKILLERNPTSDNQYKYEMALFQKGKNVDMWDRLAEIKRIFNENENPSLESKVMAYSMQDQYIRLSILMMGGSICHCCGIYVPKASWLGDTDWQKDILPHPPAIIETAVMQKCQNSKCESGRDGYVKLKFNRYFYGGMIPISPLI